MSVKQIKLGGQNSPEWIAAHKDTVTGSVADQLLTKGLDACLKQDFGSFKGNYYTQRGHILEVEAIEIYNAIYETKTDRPDFVVNDAYTNAGCSPDGIDGDWLIEVKAFGSKKHLEIQKVKDIPFKIMSQLQFNMMITELKKARLVMYNPDIEDDDLAFCVLEVKADGKIQANMAQKLSGDEETA